MNRSDIPSEVNRRDFLRGGSLSSIMLMMGGVALNTTTQAQTAYKTSSPPVNCGVIGCGPWGREILQTLGRLPNAPVVAISDSYEAFMRRGKELAPKAQAYADYKELLANKDVKAVIIATPTHQHKQVVMDAIKAGKHIYCEAPLAHTVEEAREIALASKKNPKVYFQAGLQMRADPELENIRKFIESGAMGKCIKAKSQFHKKQSWRRTSSNSDRERETNWRLDKAISPGLVGEIGIHHLDLAAWFLKGRPKSVTGFGTTMQWKDGREVPDSVQAIVEYQDGMLVTFESTLANSFDSEYDIFYGTDAAIMMRDRKSWMFKEVDSALLGWEVYARKETFYKETGIVLAANATKIAAQGEGTAGSSFVNEFSSLYYGLEAFITNTDLHHSAVEDFISNFGDGDVKALVEYMVGDIDKKKKPHTTATQAYESNVLALKANEAIINGTRINIDPKWFELA